MKLVYYFKEEDVIVTKEKLKVTYLTGLILRYSPNMLFPTRSLRMQLTFLKGTLYFEKLFFMIHSSTRGL